MKCESCGKEYSRSVWKIHAKECIKNNAKVAQIVDNEGIIDMDNPLMYREMTFNELRQVAKDLNIDLGKNPKKDDLIVALELEKFGQSNS